MIKPTISNDAGPLEEGTKHPRNRHRGPAARPDPPGTAKPKRGRGLATPPKANGEGGWDRVGGERRHEKAE